MAARNSGLARGCRHRGVKPSHLSFDDGATGRHGEIVFSRVVVIANVVFPMVLGAQIGTASPTGLPWSLWTVFVPYLFFGFYGNCVRGMF